MGVMDSNTVKESVREATDMVSLVSQYTTLQSAGRRMKGLSPFSNEKTPSFFVDPEGGVYYCFSTQKGGDVFSFVQEMEGVDFREALKILAEKAGIDITAGHTPKQHTASLYHVLEHAAALYREQMSDDVVSHLTTRGISAASIKQWGIGYAPDAWHTICTPQTAHMENHIQTGMCIRKEKNIYDRFRDRIVFPFHDTQHRVIGFSGREYKKETGAKYINSPESPLFHKSTFLYGLHTAKQHIRRNNFSILTEGVIDTVMVHQAGYPVAVASSGTAVTQNHLRQLQRLSNRLLIALDSDGAGVRATLRVITLAFSIGMDVKVVVLPESMDPADIIARDPREFKAAVKDAMPSVAFIFKHITDTYGKLPEDTLRGVKEELIPIIVHIQDPLIRDRTIQETASFCSVSREAIEESVQLAQQKVPARRPKQVKAVKERQEQKRSERKNSEKRLAELATSVAGARDYLVLHNITVDESLQERIAAVADNVHLPESDERILAVEYEEGFSNPDTRFTCIQDELRDMLSRLEREINKSLELKKIRESDMG